MPDDQPYRWHVTRLSDVHDGSGEIFGYVSPTQAKDTQHLPEIHKTCHGLPSLYM